MNTHGSFMDMPLARFVEMVHYKKRLASFIPELRADGLMPSTGNLNLWCVGDHVCRVWLISSRQY